jgi:hypothetical protein
MTPCRARSYAEIAAARSRIPGIALETERQGPVAQPVFKTGEVV